MRSILIASLLSLFVVSCGEKAPESSLIKSEMQLSTVVFKARVIISYVRPIPFDQIQRFARGDADRWQDVPEGDKELRAFVKEIETLPFVDTNAHNIRMTLLDQATIDSPRSKIVRYFDSPRSDEALLNLRSFLSVNEAIVSKKTIANALLNALHCDRLQCKAQVIELFEGFRGLTSVDADLVKFSKIDFNGIMNRISNEVRSEPDTIH